MYSESFVQDAVRVAKAAASNVLARWAPSTYVRLTQQTGRGAGAESPEEIAQYFWECFQAYREQLQIDEAGFEAFVRGSRVLEYGPGDVLGPALLFHAYGAEEVECVDRFPLQHVTPKNARVYECLMARLPEEQRSKAMSAFVRPGDPSSGLRPEAVRYRVTPDGLSGRAGHFDLIVSRAVLEHVNSLDATLNDVAFSLRAGGASVHNVDLRSHTLDRHLPFDFLTWPEPLYKLMYSHKGFPNRWRPDAYRRILLATGLELVSMKATGRIGDDDVGRIRPHLARHLRQASTEDLSWTGFWMVLRQPTRATP